MRVFVAGATGVVGQFLVPSLVAAGHEVTGTTRSAAKAATLQAAGATPVIVDGLDRRAVLDAVKAAQPEVIVHQMTALASMSSALPMLRIVVMFILERDPPLPWGEGWGEGEL